MTVTHLAAARRWDNHTSAMSIPLQDLISAVEATRARFAEIPRRAWHALVSSPDTVDALRSEPVILPREIVLLFGLVRISLARHRSVEERVASLAGLPPKGIRVVDRDGPVRVGDHELHDVVQP